MNILFAIAVIIALYTFAFKAQEYSYLIERLIHHEERERRVGIVRAQLVLSFVRVWLLPFSPLVFYFGNRMPK